MQVTTKIRHTISATGEADYSGETEQQEGTTFITTNEKVKGISKVGR